MAIRIYTYKDRRKLLSPVAHDLCLEVERFVVDRDGDRVTVRCEAGSIRVEGKVVRGVVESMRDRDRRDIEKNVQAKVLRTKQHPEVRFEGVFERGRVSGELSLVGRGVPLDFEVATSGDRLRGRVEFAPSRWGIAPFKALLGAISLEDRVVVEFDVPL